MEHPSENVEQRLQKVLPQLRNEMIIFERLMYKNTNQHRRALYFRRLCQVRGELRLLQSARLSQLLQSFEQFHQSKIQSRVEESIISKFKDLRRHIYGAVRLLDQITESILSASIQISDLLGQTFFMAFTLTMLATLARVRVLSQQALHDFIHIFNLLARWSIHKPEENDEIPDQLDIKWDDEGNLSFETTYTHRHREIVLNITEQECSPPCSSMPGSDFVEKASVEFNSESGKGLKQPIPDVGLTEITTKKVAYVSACKINLLQTEKSEDTTQHAKKQKTDALYEMLLGLHDTTKDALF